MLNNKIFLKKRLLVLAMGAVGAMTAGADELYVEPSGVGIGIPSPERLLHVRGQNAAFRLDRPVNSAGFMLVRTDAAYNPMKTFFVGVNSSSANVGEFVINDLGNMTGGAGTRRLTITNSGEAVFTGVVRAPAFAQTSSLRFKDHVRPIDHAMDGVRQLNGVRFDWKKTGAPAIGLIAEEVAKVYPELVEMENDAPVAVNYAAMVAVLLEAVKEQDAQIKSQQLELARLNKEVVMAADTKRLESRLVALEAAYTKLLTTAAGEAGEKQQMAVNQLVDAVPSSSAR